MIQTQDTLQRPKLACTPVDFDPHVPSSICIFITVTTQVEDRTEKYDVSKKNPS